MIGLFINKIVIDWNRVPYDSYVRRIPALKNLDSLSFSKNITIFTGENGSGKSTLLEAMAVAYGFNPEGGTWNYSFSTRDSHSELYDGLKLIRDFHKPHWGYFLRAESFYNVASAEEVYAREGLIPSLNLHNQSHGESFLNIVQTQFKEDSLYFLDEPEAALSPQRQLTLLIEISQLAQ
ncbi:MAG: AAA family ATPase, partial [Erysipelotrichaceae bacterium]|nr:AAA family ATPase [Erysipelotrichaceae bacterium]